MSVLNIMSHHDLYYFDYSDNVSKSAIAGRLLLVLNCLVNFFSWYMVYHYGLGDFSQVSFSGNYAIGFKLYYISQYGAPCSIFYPVDKPHEKLVLKKTGYKAYKRWLDYKNADFYLINWQEVKRWQNQ